MKRLNNKGVSEIIGTMLLLVIAISTFSVLAVYVFSNNSSVPAPHVNLVGYMDENHNAIIENKGGDSLNLENVKIVIWKGEEDSQDFMFTKQMILDYNRTISLPYNSMFYDENNNRKWDVGDKIRINCTARFGNITHWQISVIVVDENSNSIIMSGVLQTGILRTVPPVATFTYEPLNPKVGRAIIFNASQSYDPDGGSIVKYVWSFGDSSPPETKYTPVTTHQYTQAGVYHVTLTITDNDGQQSSITSGVGIGASIPPVNVTVNQPPVAYFTNVTEDDGWVYFDASNSYDPDGAVVKYIWDFGDGNTQIKLYDPTIKWQYTKGGTTYNVTLVVEDDDGATSSEVSSYNLYRTLLYVPPIPPIVIITTPADISTASDAFFSGADSYDPDGDALVNFSWDFDGDGVADAYGVNVTYHFYQVGNYTINLTVTDSSGGVGYATRTIYVRAPIAARRFLIVDNTPVNRGFNGINNILSCLNIGDVYDYGKAIDLPNNYFYSYHNETGWYNWSDGNPVSILAKVLDEYDIVIWSTGDFPGDGDDDGSSQFDHYNYWTTPMTEGYDDYSDHVYEIAQHLDHNGTILLFGSYAVRDLQDYWGNGANQDEIDLGNRLGLVESTGGIDESLHSGIVGHFTDGTTFSYGPIYAKGTLYGLPGTSSGGVNLTIEQPIAMYSLIKQSSSDFEYSLQSSSTSQEVTLMDEDFESQPQGWTHGGAKDEWEWGVPIFGPSGAHSGSKVYGTDLDNYYENNANCWLMTPEIDLTGYSQATLEFYDWYYIVYSWWYGYDHVYLEITDNGGATWHQLDDFHGNQQSWTYHSYDLSSYAGKTIQIRWRLDSDSSYRSYGYYLDDVKITAKTGGSSSIPAGYYAIDAVRGKNRSIVLGFDLNSPYINDTDRENYILNVVNWMAEAVGYPTAIYVDNNKPQSWYDDTHVGNIQDAIDRVMVGGTIYVNGTSIPYTSFNAIKSVNIMGVDIGNGYPMIKTNGDYAVKIGVDWVSIRNFTIESLGNLNKGIYIESASSITIFNCTISDAGYGIYAYGSNYLSIENNVISNNDYNIYLERCVKGEIEDNTIQSGNYGIYMEDSPKMTVEGNNIVSNNEAGIYLSNSNDASIRSNEIHLNKYGLYAASSSSGEICSNEIYNNSYGIRIEQSPWTELHDNNITNSTNFALYAGNYSNNLNIYQNRLSDNGDGLSICNSNYITVYNNSIYSNDVNNIKLDKANNNVIYRNKVRNSNYGIYLESAISNRIMNNSVWENSYGIYGYAIMDARIEGNIINDTGNAIFLDSSHSAGGNNTISFNVINDGQYGITLSGRSDENTITNNTIYNTNNWGIAIKSFSANNEIRYNNIAGVPYGIYIKDSSYNNVSFNVVSSPSIAIYFSSADSNVVNNDSVVGTNYGIYVALGSNGNEIRNTTIHDCLYGLYISSSYSTTAVNNIITNSTDGILLENSDTAVISGNTLAYNSNGIHLISAGGSGNTIRDNTIYNNTRYGIFLEYSKESTAGNNEMINNTVYGNGEWGIYLYSSSTNSITQNRIYENGQGIFANLSDDNTIDSNLIHDNSGYGLYLISSNGNRINNNSISFSTVGIYFYRASQGDQYKIGGNRIWNTTIGIFLNESDSNYFGYNIINQIW
ncbi:MAG: right-handed parallel beta-helix repeat-containing protein, partial [Thermoplasmata archaeon]|nr:right-handed parallel beta-helix repeat-containing protein [Thermoplasmata archaeon]